MAAEGKSSEETSTFRVRGLCAAPFTSFNDDGSLDVDGGVTSVVKALDAGKVRFAFVGGTTGESLKMTVAERKSLLERYLAVIQETGIDLTVIAHVGCESLTDAIDLAKHAASCGVPAIGVMPSVFFKPSSIDALVDWVAAVAKEVPDTAVYYYHIKIMTGVNIRMDKFLEAAGPRIPNLVGVKFSDADCWEFACCQRVAGGKYDMLYGKDEQLLAAMAMGCKGAVGSTYNYMAPEYHRMIAAFEAGDMATALRHQANSGELVKILHNGGKYGAGVNIGKAILQLKGVRIGPPRAPSKPISEEGLALLKKDLSAIGFFEWCD